MVFQRKLPEPSRRKRASAYDVARDHGLDIATVMDAIAKAGEFVDSPRKHGLEPPVVRRVCEILGVACRDGEPSKPVPAWQLQDTAALPTRAPSKPRLPAAPPARTKFVAPDRSERLGFESQDASPSFAAQEWKLYGFSEVERDLWISGGLREGQAKLARDLRAAGFRPTDLKTEVAGWTVAKRLRIGERPRDVLKLLHQSQDEQSA